MSMDRQSIVRQVFRDRAKLIAYAWTIVRDEHVAEDIFQTVAALAVERCDEIEDADHLAGWIRRAARFEGLKHQRTARRKPVTFDADLLDQLDSAWQNLDALSTSDTADALRHCVTQLTDHNRRLVQLRYAEGLSGIATAEAVGRPARTVYQALSRIHRTLAECIRRRLAQEQPDA